jgi:hypothetical protein
MQWQGHGCWTEWGREVGVYLTPADAMLIIA